MEFQDFQRQINKADLSKILDEGILDRASRLWDNNLPEFEKIIHILQTNLLNFDAPFVFYGAGTLTEKIFSQLLMLAVVRDFL